MNKLAKFPRGALASCKGDRIVILEGRRKNPEDEGERGEVHVPEKGPPRPVRLGSMDGRNLNEWDRTPTGRIHRCITENPDLSRYIARTVVYALFLDKGDRDQLAAVEGADVDREEFIKELIHVCKGCGRGKLGDLLEELRRQEEAAVTKSPKTDD